MCVSEGAASCQTLAQVNSLSECHTRPVCLQDTKARFSGIFSSESCQSCHSGAPHLQFELCVCVEALVEGPDLSAVCTLPDGAPGVVEHCRIPRHHVRWRLHDQRASWRQLHVELHILHHPSNYEVKGPYATVNNSRLPCSSGCVMPPCDSEQCRVIGQQ